MGFEQAGIAVQSAEFAKLKDIVERALTVDANKFLGAVESNGLLIRQYEEILNKGLFNKAVSGAEQAKELYEKMPAPDQGQMREFYLTRLEQVDTALRQKYKKIYRYT
jgi:hypothetical protein